MAVSQDKATKKKPSTSENHEKAPLCAEFVNQMREVFGPDQVNVLGVKEGSVNIGRLLG